MNKIVTVALIVGGLLLLDAPEAAAHKQVHNVYQPSAHYYTDYRRAGHMPYWLKRDKAFRKWYRRTHLRRHRHIAWHRLYEIFLWERYYPNNHRRLDRHGYEYRDHRGHGYRDYDDDSDRRRHKRH